jgi:hypothetical protein
MLLHSLGSLLFHTACMTCRWYTMLRQLELVGAMSFRLDHVDHNDARPSPVALNHMDMKRVDLAQCSSETVSSA